MQTKTKPECVECGNPSTVEREGEINRTAYRHGVEFEEDVPVTRHYCGTCDPEAPSRCEGCDDAPQTDEADVRLVALRREKDGEWHLARWCTVCRSMAEAAVEGHDSYGAAGLETVAELRVDVETCIRCGGLATHEVATGGTPILGVRWEPHCEDCTDGVRPEYVRSLGEG